MAALLEASTKKGDKKLDTKDFWLKLEAERLDQSYKRPPQRYAPQLIVVDKPTDHRKRDNIMFQAGRHSMGARDEAAIKGHKAMLKLIPKQTKRTR